MKTQRINRSVSISGVLLINLTIRSASVVEGGCKRHETIAAIICMEGNAHPKGDPLHFHHHTMPWGARKIHAKLKVNLHWVFVVQRFLEVLLVPLDVLQTQHLILIWYWHCRVCCCCCLGKVASWNTAAVATAFVNRSTLGSTSLLRSFPLRAITASLYFYPPGYKACITALHWEANHSGVQATNVALR